MRFSQVLCVLFAFNGRVRRAGWRNNNWWLCAQDFGFGLELRRVGPGDTNLPWGPTEADMLTEDWESEDDALTPYITEGTFGWALDAAISGAEIEMGWLRMSLKADNDGVLRLLVRLPNGAVFIFRPQLQDMLRKDWSVVPQIPPTKQGGNMEYAQKMTKTREEMNDLDLPWGGGAAKVVEDSIIDQRRWSTVHELVFRLPGMPEELAYRTHYSEGSTECQDESPWEYEAAECVLVRAVPVTRVGWRPVSEM